MAVTLLPATGVAGITGGFTDVLVNGGSNTVTTGWTAGANSTLAVATTAPTPYEGAGYLRVRRSTGSGRAYASQTFGCSPGDVVRATGRFSAEIALDGWTMDITLSFMAGAVLISAESHYELAGAQWQYMEKTFTVPTGGAWAGVTSVVVEFGLNNCDTTSGVCLDAATFGFAPKVATPYLQTATVIEDPDGQRGVVTSDRIGFQGNTGGVSGLATYNDHLVVASASGTTYLQGNMKFPNPYIHVGRSTAQSIPTGGSGATIQWNSILVDPGGLSTSFSLGVFTFPEDGIWAAMYAVRFPANATGTYRQVQLVYNGANAYGITKIPPLATAAGAMVLSNLVISARNAGDTVHAAAYHDATAAINAESSNSYFLLTKIGSLT